MAEIRTVTTLRSKAYEIVASINAYERRLNQARADLAHVTAIIRLFEASGEPADMPRYVNFHRLFRRHEKIKLCLDALADGADLSTREIAFYVIRAKGFDEADGALVIVLVKKLVHTLRHLAAGSQVVMVGKRRGMCVWRMPCAQLPPQGYKRAVNTCNF
jgi:hypothetical protein